jgi:hypothetical protein
MRTTPDFIADMTKHAKSTDFACFVRNYTSNAVRLAIPFGTLEAHPKMLKEAHARMVATNRERYAARPDPPRQAAADPEPARPESVVQTQPIDDDWRS